MTGDHLEHTLGRCPLGEDHAGGTDAESEERNGIPGITEEKLRHRQHHVVLAIAEHPARAYHSKLISGSW